MTDYSHIDKRREKEILEGILSGGGKGARLFLKEYGGIIKKAVDSVGIKDHAFSEEDLFMAAMENLLKDDMKAIRSFRGNSKFSTYLYTICRRHAIAVAGSNRGITFEEFTDTIPVTLHGEVGAFDEKDKQTLAKAIFLCNPDDRIFIRMMFYDERSTMEIMNFFGWKNTSPVFSRKNKVVAKLKANMRRLLLKTE